jgi:hypothetical protein
MEMPFSFVKNIPIFCHDQMGEDLLIWKILWIEWMNLLENKG